MLIVLAPRSHIPNPNPNPNPKSTALVAIHISQFVLTQQKQPHRLSSRTPHSAFTLDRQASKPYSILPNPVPLNTLLWRVPPAFERDRYSRHLASCVLRLYTGSRPVVPDSMSRHSSRNLG